MFHRSLSCLVFSCAFGFMTNLAQAEDVSVAVAANFTEPVKQIAEIFEAETGHKVTLSFGATGTIFNQIRNGAPFEVFLAADQQRPSKVAEENLGDADSQFTYAIGTLVLWSPQADLINDTPAVFDNPEIQHIAYSNVEAAPYGRAAMQALQNLDLWEKLQPRLVEGHNISQTYQFVKTGNAQVGFVALSQVIGENEGSSWIIPQDLYDPIRQDAILLKTGEDNPAATAFMEFLKGPEAGEIIRNFGYQQ